MTRPDPISSQDLMRYLDGELAPPERLRIEVALEESAELRDQLRSYQALRADFHHLSFQDPSSDRSVWDHVRSQVVRSPARRFIGVGVVAWLAYTARVSSQGVADPWERITISGVAIGVLVLFSLVIRERFRSWSEDR